MQYTSLHHKHTKPQCNKITTIWSSTPRFKINVHFETQECIGAILFSVGPGFDRNGCIGTRSGTALRTIMVSLPQLILGHVILQHNPSRIPLGTGTANRGEATCDGTLVRGFAHGDFVSGTLFGVWQLTETKDEGKRQWGTKDPNAIPQLFYGRSNRFEYGSDASKERIQSTSVRPKAATIRIDDIAHKIRNVIAIPNHDCLMSLLLVWH